MNVGSYSTEIQIDNAEKGRNIILACQVIFTIVFLLFIIYHIGVVNHESRNLKNVNKGNEWQQMKDKPMPLSVKEFSVMITNIDKNYKGNIKADIRNSLGKYGGKK